MINDPYKEAFDAIDYAIKVVVKGGIASPLLKEQIKKLMLPKTFVREELRDCEGIPNPYDEWDEKTGKTREREKHLWHGFDEGKEKVIESLQALLENDVSGKEN